MSPRSFRRVALAAWSMQAVIIASGAAVRLTDAGLGCEDWPTCNEGNLLPEAELHGMVEFGNRVISLLVAVSAVAVVVAAYRLAPRRSDLTKLAWTVLGGTVAQVVLGGITVLTDLHPIVVSVHFLLSMGLLFAAQTLHLRSGSSWSGLAATRAPSNLTGLLLGLSAVVLVLGTLVTGTGPNSGDTMADRLNFELETVARFHSTSVWVFLFVLLVSVRQAMVGSGRQTHLFSILRWLLIASVAQGILGYIQYGLGVPPLLVELHVIGAIVTWTLAIAAFWADRTQPADQPGSVQTDPDQVPEWAS